MQNILFKRENRTALLIVFLLFFLINPYFFWRWYGNLFVNILVTTIAMLVMWKYGKTLVGKQKTIFVFYVLLWMLYLANEFIKGARLGVVAYFPYALLGLVPFVRKDFAKIIFSYFFSFYAILIGISMVSWLLAITGRISPIGEFGMGNESLEAQQKMYIIYPMSLISLGVNMQDINRFCGVFDEPGVVGTLGGLLLCAKRYNMKDWRCIIILISGLLASSMFFYAITAVYWLGELIFVRRKTGAVLFLVAGIISFYVLTKDNDMVSSLVWERFEWSSEKGGFQGNSRETDMSSLTMNKIQSTGEIWFGVKDKKAFWENNYGTSSIYNVIALYGIIFVIMYTIWLLSVGYYYKVNKWDYLLYCFVVIGCLYQRTNVFSFPYVFLYASIARYYEFGSPIKLFEKKQK